MSKKGFESRSRKGRSLGEEKRKEAPREPALKESGEIHTGRERPLNKNGQINQENGKKEKTVRKKKGERGDLREALDRYDGCEDRGKQLFNEKGSCRKRLQKTTLKEKPGRMAV